jgi:hypothetical protein
VFEAVPALEATGDFSAEATTRPEVDQAERGAPFASEPERSSETLPVPATQPAAKDPVETVNDKPAAPRRGWWQRLVQS